MITGRDIVIVGIQPWDIEIGSWASVDAAGATVGNSILPAI